MTKKRATVPNGLPLDEQSACRQDFPINWSQDHFVARRDFTRFLVLTSLPFALVQVGLGLMSGFRRHEPLPIKAIAPLADIPIGGALVFHYPEEHEPCLLLRLDAGTLRAFSQKCTHLGCAVTPEPEHQRFVCPCHRGSFAVDDGRPLAGPPRRPLPRITLEVCDGILYATGVEVKHL